MPEHDQQERLVEGSTVEERDAVKLARTRATLEELRLERHGVVTNQDPVDADIPPVSVIGQSVEPVGQVSQLDPYRLPLGAPVRITVEKDQLTAALRTGVDKEGREQLKEFLKAA